MCLQPPSLRVTPPGPIVHLLPQLRQFIHSLGKSSALLLGLRTRQLSIPADGREACPHHSHTATMCLHCHSVPTCHSVLLYPPSPLAPMPGPRPLRDCEEGSRAEQVRGRELTCLAAGRNIKRQCPDRNSIPFTVWCDCS